MSWIGELDRTSYVEDAHKSANVPLRACIWRVVSTGYGTLALQFLSRTPNTLECDNCHEYRSANTTLRACVQKNSREASERAQQNVVGELAEGPPRANRNGDQINNYVQAYIVVVAVSVYSSTVVAAEAPRQQQQQTMLIRHCVAVLFLMLFATTRRMRMIEIAGRQGKSTKWRQMSTSPDNLR